MWGQQVWLHQSVFCQGLSIASHKASTTLCAAAACLVQAFMLPEMLLLVL
jgi:hypothetical protein